MDGVLNDECGELQRVESIRCSEGEQPAKVVIPAVAGGWGREEKGKLQGRLTCSDLTEQLIRGIVNPRGITGPRLSRNHVIERTRGRLPGSPGFHFNSTALNSLRRILK